MLLFVLGTSDSSFIVSSSVQCIYLVNLGSFVLKRRGKCADFKAGSMTVDLHLRQDHLGSAIEGLAALGAQVFLMHDSV